METASSTIVYIGTQVAETGRGIFAARLDQLTGRLTGLGPVAEVERPTWLLADRARRVLYAVSEVGNAGDRDAEVLSFSIAGTDGALSLLSRANSGGRGATHLELHPGGRRLFVANFGGGQVASLPVADDGHVGPPLSVQTNHGSGPHRRQTKPHAHGVTLDPAARFLLVPDMGADRVFVYRHDEATGALSPAECPYAQLPAGSGPRLTLFSRDGRFVFLLTELSAQIFVFRWDPSAGLLDEVASLAIDEDANPDDRSAAAFAMSRDGRFLYASNRRTSTLHVYAIDAETGGLRAVQAIASGGARPWGIEMDPLDRWMLVANQASNNVCVLAVDSATGRLSPVAGEIAVPVPTGLAVI